MSDENRAIDDPVTLAKAGRLMRKAIKRQEEEAKIAEYIQKIVDAAPPLTPEQRDRLALLLRPLKESAVEEYHPRPRGRKLP